MSGFYPSYIYIVAQRTFPQITTIWGDNKSYLESIARSFGYWGREKVRGAAIPFQSHRNYSRFWSKRFWRLRDFAEDMF